MLQCRNPALHQSREIANSGSFRIVVDSFKSDGSDVGLLYSYLKLWCVSLIDDTQYNDNQHV